jgi:hypothetical protein
MDVEHEFSPTERRINENDRSKLLLNIIMKLKYVLDNENLKVQKWAFTNDACYTIVTIACEIH